MLHPRCVAVCVLLLAACKGEITGWARPVQPESPAARPHFTCAPESKGSVTPLRRLSVLQYRNSLKALFPDTAAFQPLTVAAGALAALPADEAGATFRGMDDRLSEQHVQVFYDVALKLAQGVADSPAVLSAVAGACAADAPTMACVDAFLDGFGARVYRRPLTATERARYRALNDGTRDHQELFRALVFSLLMAPQFLFHTELEGTPVDGNELLVRLDAYELASRLSFHFWQGPPDQTLLEAAADGSLLTEEGYQRQLTRIAADERTRKTAELFFSEWFQLGRITQFPSTEVFKAFAQGTTIGAAGADHLAAGDAEILAMTDYFTWTQPGPLRDLLTTRLSFTRSSHLASLYGVPVWDGASTPPLLPEAERAGLLTRFAFLTSGTHSTHPIHRGAVVQRRLMCTEISAPPVASLPPNSLVPPPPNPDQTTRQRFANKVVNEPCASCHRMMDPIGYTLEQYDSIGRFRTQEITWDLDTGARLNTLPLDTTAMVSLGYAAPRTLHDAVELSTAVADSGRFEACFAQQYFRFTFHRRETAEDGCTLEALRVPLTGPAGLREALVAVARDPRFRTRKVE